MMARNRFLCTSLVAATLGVAGAPDRAPAQTVLTLSSSMSVLCANAGCTSLRFYLDVAGAQNVYVKFFELNSAGSWSFASLASVYSVTQAADVTAGFGTTITNSNMRLYSVFGGTPAPLEPLIITADMGATGTSADLNYFTYRGSGCYSSTCGYGDPPDILFTGTVTPEPVSILLMGSGLLGLAGAAARRRRRESADV